MTPLVSIVIINYNAKDMINSCLESLKEQTYKNTETIFIDNNSSDGSCEHLRQEFPGVTAVCNNINLGYAQGANQGIKLAKGKYVMLINLDLKFEKSYIEELVKAMEKDEKIAAICGKIYKYNFDRDHKTNYIDTVGLFSYRNRRIIDDGQGLEDKGQFDNEKEVFGVSGACAMYRKEALEDIKYEEEYLDKDFFMYKEDVDLSWRFRLYGWKCYYLPRAVAYHGRGTGVLKRFSHLEVARNRKKLSKFQKYYSYKNQRLMQIKNEFVRGVLSDFFPILWKEILVGGYVVFREPYLLKAFGHMVTQIPSILKKRRHIAKNRKVSWKEMNKWLSGKQSQYLSHDLENIEI